MTSTMSLFACSPADVTLERVRDLAGQDLPESLTLEYKERYSQGLVKSAAAMANTYGGLILVGVTDQPGPGRLVGVPEAAVVQIANACHEMLEPPWAPEIIPVPLAAGSTDLYVLVIRVDPARAPRPLLVGGAAPIRLQGRNATADRARLAQLFSESPVSLRSAGRRLSSPEMPANADGSPAADFVIRTGLLIPVDDVATWRPLSERAVGQFADVLNGSPLQPALLRWCTKMGIGGFNPFHRSGFNRARHARLSWQAASAEPRHPIEAIAVADLPGSYGAPASSLQVTLDVIISATAYLAAVSPTREAPAFRLPVPDLYATIDALLAALTDRAVTAALAGLAGIDPVIVPVPANLDFITGPPVTDLLHPDGLAQIPDAGNSHGANLLANPTLDLADPGDRRSQLDDWLQQIALDAGLSGMENLLAAYHQERIQQRL
ncbi:MAG TPA: ATP-binding protein [Streptosporangiaceae bacterium]|nr:ATP-binding protein [Streptosporangiaceae bacterium]